MVFGKFDLEVLLDLVCLHIRNQPGIEIKERGIPHSADSVRNDGQGLYLRGSVLKA
jgi:hypothetical protein